MEYVYAALLLHKLEKEVNEDNLKKVVSATGAEVGSDEETKIKSLAASLKGVDIEKELENAALVSAAPSAGAPSEDKAGEKKEEKPKEEKKEAASDGLSALFG